MNHEMRRVDAIKRLKWLLDKVERDEVTVLVTGLVTPLPHDEYSFEVRYKTLREAHRPDRATDSAGESRD